MPEQAIVTTGDYIETALRDLTSLSRDAVRRARQEKFLTIGRSL